MRTSALPPIATSATLPPFPKLIVGDTSAAIGYNIGVRRMCHSAMDPCVEYLETAGGPLSSAAVTNAHHRFVYNVIRVLLKETVL